MVFRYYDFPNVNPAGDYQCGVVGSLGGSCFYDCRTCVFPAGQMENMISVLESYPDKVRQYVNPSVPDLNVTGRYSALTFAQLKAEIDAGRPVAAAITPGSIPSSAGPAHVALLVGYDDTLARPTVLVNDPFPFGIGPLGPYGDPYLQAGGILVTPGQYKIPYDVFVSAMSWQQTIHEMRVESVSPTDFPRYCCTSAGKLGPYPNNSIREGESCYGTAPNGRIYYGTACFDGPDQGTGGDVDPPPPPIGVCDATSLGVSGTALIAALWSLTGQSRRRRSRNRT
jgi:hypothetical protein